MPTISELERAIRKKCLSCCGGVKTEVDACRIQDCPLYPYRRTQGSLLRKEAANA